MPNRILIVPDKFKGTLTAQAASEAIASGWSAARPEDEIERVPMSDGGDGFGEVMRTLLGARARRVNTVDAAHRPLSATWWCVPGTQTAIIESARVIGLAQLPAGKFHPVDLDTAGLGRVIEAAASAGVRRCLIGIGGSATNDGGFGLARALGWQFLDAQGNSITRWTDLLRLEELRVPRRKRWFRELTVAVDVQNPLLGPKGCTRVYGPQKGLLPIEFPFAEACLGRLAFVAKRDLGHDFRRTPGAGAAGGLGYGLMAFLGAKPSAGFELFAQYADLERRVRSADLVITGEGALDQSTVMGKGVGEVARLCRRQRVPCLALAGTVKDAAAVRRWFAEVRGLTDLATAKRACANAAAWLERLAREAARVFTPAS